MANNSKSYKALRDELEEVISKLQDESLDIDEGLELYEIANNLVGELEEYLKNAKHRFEIINKTNK